MSERIRSSFQFIFDKLGCNNRRRNLDSKKSLQKSRLRNFDATISLIHSEDDLQECGSDCTSCENARLLDELHGVKSGDEEELNAVVDNLVDQSLLTPAMLPIINQKRSKIVKEQS